MKLKSLAVTIVAGGLFAAAGPCFAVLCSATPTLAAWAALGAAGCTDPDADSIWVFGSATVPLATTTFTLTEVTIPLGDLYNVSFDFVPPLGTAQVGETISYTATSSATEMFDAANYDTTVTEAIGVSGAMSTAHIIGTGVNLLQTSIDGSHVPAPSGETPFSRTLGIDVTDTFTAIPTGSVFNAANNSFQTGGIPEPVSLALVGLGLTAMGLVRRKRKLT